MSYRDSPTEADDAALSAADELAASAAVEHQIVKTLFDLGRQVTAVLDLDALLTKIPLLTARLISFEAFAVYLLDERRGELKVAYSVGYPDSVRPASLEARSGTGRRRRREPAAARWSTISRRIRDTSSSCPAWRRKSSCRCSTSRSRLARSTCSAATRITSAATTSAVLRQIAAHVAIAHRQCAPLRAEPPRRGGARDARRNRA